ncbi:response regulator transcription factor [Micromonospora sp. NPDC002575]|uniref:helix-turn-helix transcriptional regulator n=1 Tax=Micromonospora sp. NPDC002575 TaxID=3364222 RepID=UPI0036C66737
MEQVRVAVHATDPLSRAGIGDYLRHRAEVTLLDDGRHGEADVLLVVADRLTTDVVAVLRRNAAESGAPTVLIANEISQAELITAVDCRVVAIQPRAAVTADRLVDSVVAARDGGGVMPPNLVGELLKHIERLQRDVLTPHGLTASGLNTRELDVLRLMAEGLDTNEIASRLCYSERTVKNVIYGFTHRLKLRNRSHAVAYALRSGMI